jgi:superfamily I DNA/RNA helicase
MGLIDFTDMLIDYYNTNRKPPVRVAFVDEAQDLTPIQWKIVFKLFADVDQLYVAGDDDQSIFTWSGADVNQFLNLPYTTKETLPLSHRLPKDVFKFSDRIIQRVAQRYQKDWEPQDKTGGVEFHNQFEHLDIDNGKEWFILARNSYLLSKFKDYVEHLGMTYTSKMGDSIDVDDIESIKLWENQLKRGEKIPANKIEKVLKRLSITKEIDRSKRYSLNDLGLQYTEIWHKSFNGISKKRRLYYKSVLVKGDKLDEKPKIHIDTIHSQKGGEADEVVLITDWSHRTAKNFEQDPDPEHRVFYVGATRAKENLHILMPQTTKSYTI